MLRFFKRLQPLDTRGGKNLNNRCGLDQLEVPGVADATAVFRFAPMRVFGRKPGGLRRNDAVRDQQHEHELRCVTARPRHSPYYNRLQAAA